MNIKGCLSVFNKESGFFKGLRDTAAGILDRELKELENEPGLKFSTSPILGRHDSPVNKAWRELDAIGRSEMRAHLVRDIDDIGNGGLKGNAKAAAAILFHPFRLVR